MAKSFVLKLNSFSFSFKKFFGIFFFLFNFFEILNRDDFDSRLFWISPKNAFIYWFIDLFILFWFLIKLFCLSRFPSTQTIQWGLDFCSCWRSRSFIKAMLKRDSIQISTIKHMVNLSNPFQPLLLQHVHLEQSRLLPRWNSKY